MTEQDCGCDQREYESCARCQGTPYGYRPTPSPGTDTPQPPADTQQDDERERLARLTPAPREMFD